MRLFQKAPKNPVKKNLPQKAGADRETTIHHHFIHIRLTQNLIPLPFLSPMQISEHKQFQMVLFSQIVRAIL